MRVESPRKFGRWRQVEECRQTVDLRPCRSRQRIRTRLDASTFWDQAWLGLTGKSTPLIEVGPMRRLGAAELHQTLNRGMDCKP
jgi:hypothetical protein